MAVLLAACDDDNKPTTYKVTFDADGGAPEVASQTVKSGQQAQQPQTNPTKEGFVFTNWINTANNQSYDFSTPVTTDLSLKAVYEEVINLTFNTDIFNNSTIERYALTITKKGANGAPDEELANTVLQKNFYDLKPLLSKMENTDNIRVSVKAYKKPTPGATAFDPATNDADGRVLAGVIDKTLSGSQLKKTTPLIFETKTKGTIKLALDFKPFIDYLKAQGNTSGIQQLMYLENYSARPNTNRWILLATIYTPGKVVAGNTEAEAHNAIDAASNYVVRLTLTFANKATTQKTYRFLLDSRDFKNNVQKRFPNPIYAGEIVDKTAEPLLMDEFDKA